MSLLHSFHSQNTRHEHAYFNHNFIVRDLFCHLFGDNYDGDWYVVSKRDINRAVAILEEVLDPLSLNEHVNYFDFDNEKKMYMMAEKHLLLDWGGSRAMYNMFVLLPDAVTEYLNFCSSNIKYAVERLFNCAVDAYITLKNLQETFDFENDKLIVSQTNGEE